jgi:peptidoglycan hydrolase FlgJ
MTVVQAKSAAPAIAGALPSRQAGAVPDRNAVARQKFDAYFLQAVLEQALPKKANAVFGAGFSGDVMRSMLAERVATEISKRGSLSVAGPALLRADHPGQLKPVGSMEPAVIGPEEDVIRATVR